MRHPGEDETDAATQQDSGGAGEQGSNPAGRTVALQDARVQEVRERIAQWLEETLADEALPAGVPGELAREILEGRDVDAGDGTDLYGLQGAVTALTTEVKLQGRSFDRLGRSLGDVERLVQAVESMDAQADRRGGAGEPADQVLMDVRDRLDRGAQAARRCLERAGAQGRLRAMAGGGVADLTEAVEALQTGYEMASTRVDQALGGYGIRAVECEGEPFDPERMTVVDVQHDARQREGTVLEVVRPGYERDGEVIRFAEVRVAGSGVRDDEPAGMLDRVVRRLRRTLSGGKDRGAVR